MESLPIKRRGIWKREGDKVYLCGTLGAEFDKAHRALSFLSAAKALEVQEIGLSEIEHLMDELEEEARLALSPDEKLLPRYSPGYGRIPLAKSREILDKLDATARIGVSITDSLLLVPSKSVTAICEIV